MWKDRFRKEEENGVWIVSWVSFGLLFPFFQLECVWYVCKWERDLDDDVDAVWIAPGIYMKSWKTGKMKDEERGGTERKGVISCPTFGILREYI